MLKLENVQVSLEGARILRGAEMRIQSGGTAALIGRNGAGKTTLLRTIMGFTRLSGGRVSFGDTDLASLKSHERARLGIGYAPEDRRLFSSLTVEENIALPGQVMALSGPLLRDRFDLIYEIMPEVKELRGRKAGSVSGGQGKLVALGRALMVGTSLVLLDEPFQGVAPALAKRYASALRLLRDRQPGLGLLITESNPTLLENFAETVFTIDRGAVTEAAGWQAAAAALH
jgi:branched-chain amino acid transport system ATP-binding protein